jgi:hypothetical protein
MPEIFARAVLYRFSIATHSSLPKRTDARGSPFLSNGFFVRFTANLAQLGLHKATNECKSWNYQNSPYVRLPSCRKFAYLGRRSGAHINRTFPVL